MSDYGKLRSKSFITAFEFKESELILNEENDEMTGDFKSFHLTSFQTPPNAPVSSQSNSPEISTSVIGVLERNQLAEIEEQIQKEIFENELTLAELRVKSAIKIQAIWRGFHTRRSKIGLKIKGWQ